VLWGVAAWSRECCRAECVVMCCTGHDDTMLECIVAIIKETHSDDDCDDSRCSEGFMTVFRIS